jgi:hypothetical protein
LQEDRMPPLSYWIGWVWSKAFGLGETQMRWFSVVCTGLATAFVFKTTQRTWGLKAGLGAGLLFALSPNVIDRAVGIRCYALFTLTASMTFFFLTGLLTDRSGKSAKWIIGMTLSAIAAMYTHFFGVILAGACMSAALVLFYLQGRPVRSVAVAIAITGVASLGLIPFITASLGTSERETINMEIAQPDRVRATAQWGYRQFSHPATSVSRVAVAAAIVGFFLCSGTAAWCALSQRSPESVAATGTGMALFSGSLVILGAQFVISTFGTTQSNYSVWMQPGWAIFFASALRGPRTSLTALLGVTLLLAADGYGTAQLLRRGDVFAPTPTGQIARMISEYNSDHMVVVYEGDRDGMLYFPIRFMFKNNVRQYIYSDGSLASYPPSDKVVGPLQLRASTVLVIRSSEQSAAELVGQLDRVNELSPGPVATTLMKSPEWELIDNKVFLSFCKTHVRVFRKVESTR